MGMELEGSITIKEVMGIQTYLNNRGNGIGELTFDYEQGRINIETTIPISHAESLRTLSSVGYFVE